MLRVAFTSEFGRGKLQDLVALLSAAISRPSSSKRPSPRSRSDGSRRASCAFINKTHFERIHDDPALSGLRDERPDRRPQRGQLRLHPLPARAGPRSMPAADLERLVRRWYAMSILRGAIPEAPRPPSTSISARSRRVGSIAYAESVIENELPESFWTGMLPQLMDTSSGQSPYFLAYQAAQVKLGDKGFLSRDITVLDLLMNRSDVHHVYPKKHLKNAGALTWPLQPDCQFRARPERDQHRHRRQAARNILQGAGSNSAPAGQRSTAASPTEQICAPTCA